MNDKIVQIRTATVEDIPAMQRIRGIVRENRLVDATSVQPHHILAMLQQHGRGWIAEVDGCALGFAVGDRSRSNVWALFVDPDAEGRGIGRRLHDVMMHWFFAQDAPDVWLSTDPGTRAEHFYRAAGWSYAGREANGEARYVMSQTTWRARCAAHDLAVNRAGWNQVAPCFHGDTALPEYGPLAPTEDTLHLLDVWPDMRVLELGCGSGHSLRYLAERGVQELWGLDLSPVQIAFAGETLRPFADRCRLIESPMEVNPGIPTGYFDLVFSLWGLGWTTDLPTTLAHAAQYLRPGGCLLVSGEHPAYSCLQWDGKQYIVAEPYTAEGARRHASWKGVPIVIQRCTLGTFITEVARAGLEIETLIEGDLDTSRATEMQTDPARWYTIERARLIPTTVIIKARKPRGHESSGPADMSRG